MKRRPVSNKTSREPREDIILTLINSRKGGGLELEGGGGSLRQIIWVNTLSSYEIAANITSLKALNPGPTQIELGSKMQETE